MMRAIQLAVVCVAVLVATAGQTEAGIITQDDFESYSWGSTSLSPAVWSSVANGVVWDGTQQNSVTPYLRNNLDYSTFFPSGNALFFQGSGIRSATTIALDLSLGGAISFDMSIGAVGSGTFYDGPFERQDPNENVRLRYSTDGGSNWSEAHLFGLNDPSFSMDNRWSSFQYIVNEGDISATSATMFQLIQLQHSGGAFDNWAFDNFQVTSNQISVIPEPSSLAVFGIAACVAGVGAARRRQRGKAA